MTHTLLVEAGAAGQRLDVFLVQQLKLSRAKAKALLEEDKVRVDGRRATKGVSLTLGQRIEVTVQEDVPLAEDTALELTVLHEDADLIFVDKASGIPCHPLKSGEVRTVASALVARYPEVREASEEPREGGLCHRLDIETSGVLLAARSREVWAKVRDAFGKRDIDKVYWAVVTGPVPDEGEIELALVQRGSKVVPSDDAAGTRPAHSLFRALARSKDATLVEMRIITGVMHQVRAHLAAIGAPIVGDELYGGRPMKGLDRFFLHARSLGLSHPRTKTRLNVMSELPPALTRVMQELELSLPTGR